MAGRQGYNVEKGKQGFQPVYHGAPSTMNLPLLAPPPPPGTPLENGLESSLIGYTADPAEIDATTRPPQSFIENYGWQDVLLQHSEYASLDDMHNRFGTETIASAMSRKIDRDLESPSFRARNYTDTEPYKKVSDDMAVLCRTILDDNSGRFDSQTKESARIVMQGHIGKGKLNTNMITILDEPMEDGTKPIVFSRHAGNVLYAAGQVAKNPSSRTRDHMEKYQEEASIHKEYLANPAGMQRPKGLSMKNIMQPSPLLVRLRREKTQLHEDLKTALVEARQNKNPFKRRQKETAVDQIRNTITHNFNSIVRLEKNDGLA